MFTKKTIHQTNGKPTPGEFRASAQNVDKVDVLLSGYCHKEDDESISEEVMWVSCSKCNIWMHLLCIQRQGQQLKDDDYICTLCQSFNANVLSLMASPVYDVAMILLYKMATGCRGVTII